ncbi:MAG: MinD/ParA family protein [Betaproteobacteria bacterium]|nr:MinD/ParA family protein [Betaproteobacteria bacterium]
MARTRPDQAEGLRRLLDRSGLRVVSISASASGKAGAIVNLAGALAERGSDVLILDEHPAAHSVAAALGLKARFDLEDVIRSGRDLDEVIVRGPAGIRILPLARGARSLAQLPAPEQRRLVERCARLGFPVDTLLVDAAPGSTSALLWPGTAAQEVIVIAGGNAAAITAAYALIKRLANEFARREFHVLVDNVASEREARTIFGNMAGVARRYLHVSLAFMGHVPPDAELQHAVRLRLPVVAAFPGAAAAGSFRCLAQAIAGWPRAEEDGCGFDDFMRRLIHSNRLRAAAA